MNNKAILKIDSKEYELPVRQGTENEVGVDISKLRAQTGAVTLDNGYGNTGSCESSITYLDGEKGILRYRGYDINELCIKSSFLEVSYLLIYGELPSQIELDKFVNTIRVHTMINEEYKRYYDVWPNSAHPMAILASAVAGMSTFYQDSLDPYDDGKVDISTIRLLAKIPSIAAYAYKKSIGQPFIYPLNKLSYAGNFLNMMFSVPSEEYNIDPIVERALNQLFILHADHEQNCSTSTVRMVGSSDANIFASMAAAILALSGPLHGGANQAVLEMLKEIKRGDSNVKHFVNRAKQKNDPFRLMGFGHRVYKNFDPRCTIIKETANQVLKTLNIHDELLDIAHELEEIALKDNYFIEKKLYPNVDFYSGIIYRALGFPTNMFTVLFAIGRLPGWIAHWREMRDSSDKKIHRPRQIYTGATVRKYVDVSQR